MAFINGSLRIVTGRCLPSPALLQQRRSVTSCSSNSNIFSRWTSLSSLSSGKSQSKLIYPLVHKQQQTFVNKRFFTSNNKVPNQSTTPTTDSSSTSSFTKFWKNFTGPKPMPERWTLPWYKEMVLICTVFAITGSSTMVLVRPAVSNGLGLKGTLKDGPWSYRICSIVVMTPIYATLLVVVGTIFGRHNYFRHFSVKMWSRFGIPPEMLDESYHITKKNFRKW